MPRKTKARATTTNQASVTPVAYAQPAAALHKCLQECARAATSTTTTTTTIPPPPPPLPPSPPPKTNQKQSKCVSTRCCIAETATYVNSSPASIGLPRADRQAGRWVGRRRAGASTRAANTHTQAHNTEDRDGSKETARSSTRAPSDLPLGQIGGSSMTPAFHTCLRHSDKDCCHTATLTRAF